MNDEDDGDDNARPRPNRPGKPAKPYRPKPGIQAQQSPSLKLEEDQEEDESSPLIQVGDGEYCWRSGRLCESDADIFACCTKCINGICI